MKQTALVIGFGPFPGAPVNPSAELVRALSRIRRPAFACACIVARMLPTRYAAVERELPALVREHRPDIVLMFGLAGRARNLRVESQAVNARSSLHPDAWGCNPLERALIPRSPARLKAAAPLAALIAAAQSTGVNANVSHNAGRYICNAALYTCLDLRRTGEIPLLVAFVHIPWPRKATRAGKRRNRARPTANMLLRAGAAMLIALLSAARRR
jgi:pyroglutamyl-peptidase